MKLNNIINIKTSVKSRLADLYTPIGIYLRLRDQFRDTILLESAGNQNSENSFSFICVNRMFNNKMNYSEHEIIKNNFFKNNVHMKINKVNANIKMCLHHALCFWLGHADRYSNHVIRISVLFCWWEDGRKSWKQRAVRDPGWTYGLRCSGDRRAYRQNFCWSCRHVRRNRLPHRGSRIRSNSSLKRERANFS